MVKISVKSTLFTIVVWQGINHVMDITKVHLTESQVTEKQRLWIETAALILAIIIVLKL
jgi:hypothetical protein